VRKVRHLDGAQRGGALHVAPPSAERETTRSTQPWSLQLHRRPSANARRRLRLLGCTSNAGILKQA
jgi:hypothetical protein